MLKHLTGRASRRALIGSALFGVVGVAALAMAFAAGDAARRQRADLSLGLVLMVNAGRIDLETGSNAPPLALRTRLTESITSPARPLRLDATGRDLECLTQAIYYEARGEGASGQAAVAQVVINRVRHRAFPKTVCGVVFQRNAAGTCQFSFACDGAMTRTRDEHAWNRARKVASRALNGSVMPLVGEATHFHTAAVAPNWAPRLMQVAQIGFHVFYRFGGSAGSASAFSGTPRPSGAEDGRLPVVDPESVIAQISPPADPAVAAQVMLAGPLIQTAAPAVILETPKPAPLVEASASPTTVRAS